MTIKGKDLIARISDKEYSKELIKELEKYEVKKPKSAWELENGDVCWRVGVCVDKFEVYEDAWRWLTGAFRIFGLVHLTKERAELHARVLNTELAIKKWKRENDNVELDWNDDNQQKYHFVYDTENEEIKTYWWITVKFANTIYFSSELKARQCVNDIGEERIIEWIKWEDNDQ